MKSAGIDLHKHTITVCVMNRSRNVIIRRRLSCSDEESIRRFFESLGTFRAVIEATASYEWLVRLIEPPLCRSNSTGPRGTIDQNMTKVREVRAI